MSIKDVMSSIREWLGTPEVVTAGSDGWGKNADPIVIATLKDSLSKISDAERRFSLNERNQRMKVPKAQVNTAPRVDAKGKNTKETKGYQR